MPGKTPQPGVLQAELDALGEQDLHADADPEDRAARLDPAGDHLLAADAVQPGHAGRERAHARDHQAVAPGRGVEVGGYRDVGAHAGEGALGGAQVPRPVVEDHDLRSHGLVSRVSRIRSESFS